MVARRACALPSLIWNVRSSAAEEGRQSFLTTGGAKLSRANCGLSVAERK